MQSENGVVFKAYLDDDVRRFTVDKSAVTNYEYLKAKLQNVFPNIGRNQFTIKWVDDDGDKVSISSDEDLIVALSSIQDIVKKLYISIIKNNQSSSVNRDDEEDDEVLIDLRADVNLNELLNKPPQVWANFLKNSPHPGVVCDSCQGPVIGFRYKCIVCEDFDLCGNCEGNFAHPHHVFMRFPWPMGRNAYRASRKAGRMFKCLKKDRPFGDDNVGCPRKFRRDDSSDPFEDRRCQFGEDRKHGGRGHHGRHGGHHGEHREHHGPHNDGPRGGRFRNGRETWFQTFNKFVNEITNLAGDTYGPTEANNNTTSASANANVNAQAAPSSCSQAASAPPRSGTTIPMETQSATEWVDSNGNSSQIPIPLSDINVKILENIGATLTNILKPFGVELNMELKPANIPNEMNIRSDNNSKNTTEPTPSVSKSSAPKNDIVNDLIDPASESNKPSESPERNEDWTILNSEEHVEEATEKTPLVNKPVGFDMEKISKDFHRHVGFTVTADGASSSNPESVPSHSNAKIYPAVPQQDIHSFFSAEMLDQLKPVQPEYRPSIPHIAEALDKMISMGFKNDGGRLARLLESKNGNISEVLDILTKNIP